MNAVQKLKQWILASYVAGGDNYAGIEKVPELAEEVEEVYGRFLEAKDHWDFLSYCRFGDCKTDIATRYSLNYESRSVAAQMLDGSWVGWTFWYGGGKHGDPESIDWVSKAYSLDMKEEEKPVVVRTWSKKNV